MGETSIASLDLFPNPIVSEAVLQVTGAPGELVEVDVLDSFGNSRRALGTGTPDADGTLRKTLSVGALPRGCQLTVRLLLNDLLYRNNCAG